MTNEKWLKGSGFQNRYMIKATLTTKSPLHIGSGAQLPAEQRLGKKAAKEQEEQKKDGPNLVSGIATNFSGRPILPGSTVRGNLRNWLWQIFYALSPNTQNTFAVHRDYEDYEGLKADFGMDFEKQSNQISFMKNNASILERIFGTSFSASKLEFHDAECKTTTTDVEHLSRDAKHAYVSYWDNKRLTYVTQSVAIDPASGTAAHQKLYTFEVVPPGVDFELKITGQNISDLEMGMLLTALYAFNDAVFPVTLGAMAARGFGKFKLDTSKLKIYFLGNEKEKITKWISEMLTRDVAGYNGLEELSEARQQARIQDFQDGIKAALSNGKAVEND